MLDFLKRLWQRTAVPESDQVRENQRQSEEHFNQLVAGVCDYAIVLLDCQGNIASWNAGAQQIKGYQAKEIIGQHFSQFYPPEIVASGLPAHELHEAARTGRFEDEGWRLRKDGSRFWANVVITALRDHAGELRGYLKITRDLTGRKQAEENARILLQEEVARQAAEAGARESERVRREERRQRDQLHVTLASIGDAVIVTDQGGAVTFMNPVAERLTGWKAADASGQSLEQIFSIFNEETGLPVDNPVRKVLQQGVTIGLANHTVLRSRDGRDIPIDDSAAPIRGEDGSIWGVVLVFRDVTEARRAVEARLHLAAIVESSEDAIISKNLDGIIVSWNQGADQLYGYKADEIIGQPLARLVPPDHPDELPALMARLGRGERIEHFETVRVRKDGSRLDVSLTISPVRNAEGKIIGASKIARNITARKRSEAGLRFLAEASKLLAKLQDVPSTLQKIAGLAVPHFADWCAVDLLEPDGSLRRVAVAHVDPSKVELAHELHRRHPPDPTAERGAWQVLRSGTAELLTEIPDSLLQASVRDPEILTLIRHLGLRSYIGVPLQVRGQSIGAITFIAAESGQRYGPGDLRLAEDLAQRAGIAIENAQLYSELKETDRRKNEFLAMLSHELRNPLAPIRNALQIMKMPGVTAEEIDAARQMTERQVQHLVRLVDDLLDVSRIMRGRIELRKETVELPAIIANAVETVQPILDAQGQHLNVQLPPEPLKLAGDPTRLVQVFGNLLNNAAKYSQGPGQIDLCAECQGQEVVVRIKDQGMGMGPDLLPQVFDLFVQGDASLDRSRGGLGIGLTVVRKLIELHGGQISAHSEGIGKGSTFTVRLPLLPVSPLNPRVEAMAPQAGPTPTRKVLVVDDNLDAAHSLATLLQIWGHEICIAHSGPEALQAAATFQPEIVLLDIGLPGMNGYEVARQLRQQPRSQRLVLAAVTGYGQEHDRRQSGEAGFDHHLTKPVAPATLQNLLAEVR